MSKRTFVLVPGAWLGAWVWRRVIPLIEGEGNAVYPLTLTGMGDRVHLATPQLGIETAIQDVVNAIDYEGLEDVALVGHSFAGKVVGAVADRIPEKVNLVLYLDAFRPQKVRTPQGGFDPSEFATLKPGDWAIPPSETVLNMVGKDVVGPDRKWLLDKSTPWPVKYSTEQVTLSEKFDSVKSAYVLCTGGGDSVDEILQGKWGKLDGPYKVIDSGHWPMITKPAELARAMLELS
jgi:pimeloyl-ACP methyl ester carboxylesterase